MSGPQVLFFCQWKLHGGLEQVPLNGDRECAALQLRQAARNGEAETAALRAAGGITADEALHQLLGGNIQGVAGDIQERDAQ